MPLATVLIDWHRLGLTPCIIHLTVASPSVEAVKTFLASHPATNTLQALDDRASLLLEGVFRDEADAWGLVDEIREVVPLEGVWVRRALEECKREGWSPKPLYRKESPLPSCTIAPVRCAARR
ncbi:hypothetical protein JXB02_05615 [Candidatus Woesearchaeota archaeon]|nr:hypothetical protein [Candidatus Woesearchaeota archaeon]